MSDIEDDDDEDLWADVDEDCETTITVSENLLEAVSKAPEVVHKGDVDEGKVTWVGPEAAGLQNSVKVNEGKDQHWYKDEHAELLPPAPAAAGVMPPAAPMFSGVFSAAPAPVPPPAVAAPAVEATPNPFAAFNMFAAPGAAFPAAAPAVDVGMMPPTTMAAASPFPSIPAGGQPVLVDWANLPKPGGLFG